MIFVNGLLWINVGVFLIDCIKFGLIVFFKIIVSVFCIFKFVIVIGLWFLV